MFQYIQYFKSRYITTLFLKQIPFLKEKGLLISLSYILFILEIEKGRDVSIYTILQVKIYNNFLFLKQIPFL